MVYVGSNAGNKIRTRINAIMSVLNRIIDHDDAKTDKRFFSYEIKENYFTPDAYAAIAEIKFLVLTIVK